MLMFRCRREWDASALIILSHGTHTNPHTHTRHSNCSVIIACYLRIPDWLPHDASESATNFKFLITPCRINIEVDVEEYRHGEEKRAGLLLIIIDCLKLHLYMYYLILSLLNSIHGHGGTHTG